MTSDLLGVFYDPFLKPSFVVFVCLFYLFVFLQWNSTRCSGIIITLNHFDLNVGLRKVRKNYSKNN